MPRRFATREELLEQLRRLGAELERTPTARDLDERRGTFPSKSLYWHTFGSLTTIPKASGLFPSQPGRTAKDEQTGLRNSLLIAIAPTATVSIALPCGTRSG